MFTVTFVVNEKPGMDREQALAYWRDTHGPIVGGGAGRPRLRAAARGGQHPRASRPSSASASLSFDDQEAFAAAAASPEFAAAIEDVANFGHTQLATAITEDVVIVG